MDYLKEELFIMTQGVHWHEKTANSTHFTEGGMQIARILGKDAHFFLLEIWGRVISDQV